MACADFSGTYVSSSANPISMGKRVYTIEQTGCDLKIALNNVGTDVDVDVIRADNLAYDRSTGNFDKSGRVANPFLSASANTIRFLRASMVDGYLKVSELYSWRSQLDHCKEEFVVQADCGYTQRAFLKNGEALTETFNGYYYSNGQNQPYSIYYEKVK
jgi:hypothetical protein